MTRRPFFTLANVFLSILIVILTSCATTTPEIKQSSPTFTAVDLQGRSFGLSDYKGKNIILVFYIGHTWQPCFQQLGELQKVLPDIRALQTEVIAIASRDRRDVQKTQKVLDLEFTLVPGPNVDLMKQYGAYNFQKGVALPMTLIIDKNGVVRWKYVGKNDYDRPDVKKILIELRHLQ